MQPLKHPELFEVRCEFAPKNAYCYCCSRESPGTIRIHRRCGAHAVQPAPQLFILYRRHCAHPRRDGAHRHVRHRSAAAHRQGRQRHVAHLPADTRRFFANHLQRASFLRAVRFRRIARRFCRCRTRPQRLLDHRMGIRRRHGIRRGRHRAFFRVLRRSFSARLLGRAHLFFAPQLSPRSW